MGKGRIGEAKVSAHFAALGYEVFVPVFCQPTSDMIVCKDGALQRVQVKFCSAIGHSGAYYVSLKSVRCGAGKPAVHKFDSTKCDILAVYLCQDDKVVLLDPSPLHGRTTVALRLRLASRS
jgi:hypothetical protein